MQSIKATLRQKWFWICLNKPFWASAGLTFITVAFLAVKPAMINGMPTDLPVRFWGMVLQLVGAFTVWIDLTKTAKDFGEPPSCQKTLQWLKGLIHTPEPVQASTSVMAGGATLVGGAYITTAGQPGWPIEARVARLESDVAGIKEGLSTVRADLMRQKSELAADIKQQTTELRQEVGAVQMQLKDALVGNFAVLHFGAVWLVLGIVMSSVAVEITNFFHLHCQLPVFW